MASTKTASTAIFNVPNVLTAARFVLSIVVFVLIPLEQYAAAVVVFVIAAGTDWIDGWYARKYQQVTKLGRIFDPFVDKVIICGTFIFLAAEQGSGITPWMAVVVVGREMLVTAIRGFIEQQGGDFSAQMAGKLKMVFQCVAAVASLIALRHYALEVSPEAPREWLAEPLPAWLFWTLHVSVALAVISTVYSGAEYIVAAARILGKQGR
ncbi:MAG TPA: CDP-diacylglycerol--glycerol-3-phosphate 3-phosphatidyltransferase [Pirellulaceae bacterium]|nr:CDP-diacylglycerol--glycerol-3-phosphate 3-phosphatidyltransferase [Pirellulaceae bacterium]